MTTTLHYIHDPMCGWCYGASPLLDAIRQQWPEWQLEMHGGGLFSQRKVDHELVTYVRHHDARIQQMTGQPFSEHYMDNLRNSSAPKLDSAEAIAGVLAAEQLESGLGIAMFSAIQSAHYTQGLPVSEPAVLARLAQDLGLEESAFLTTLTQIKKEEAIPHIESTRFRMQRLGASGFPTFALETESGGWHLLPHSQYYGKPEAFIRSIKALLD